MHLCCQHPQHVDSLGTNAEKGTPSTSPSTARTPMDTNRRQDLGPGRRAASQNANELSISAFGRLAPFRRYGSGRSFPFCCAPATSFRSSLLESIIVVVVVVTAVPRGLRVSLIERIRMRRRIDFCRFRFCRGRRKKRGSTAFGGRRFIPRRSMMGLLAHTRRLLSCWRWRHPAHSHVVVVTTTTITTPRDSSRRGMRRGSSRGGTTPTTTSKHTIQTGLLLQPMEKRPVHRLFLLTARVRCG